MKINLGKLGREKREEAKKQKETEAREKCNRWDAINNMIQTPGWEILSKETGKEFQNHNSIYNADSAQLEYEKGYCDGLKVPSQFIESIKRRALEAQKVLDTLAKEKE